MSGIESMRIEFRCRQWMLRICLRDSGGGHAGQSPSSHCCHVEKIDLLAPEQARERLPLDQALVLGGARRMDRGVEFVGFRAAALDRSHPRPRAAAASCSGVNRKSQTSQNRRAGTHSL